MARCGCGSDTCNCNFIAGNNIGITGNGTRSNPYVVEATLPDDGTSNPPPGTGDATRFVGEVVAWAGLSSPAGWMVCDGTAISRQTYSDLFAVIGVGYGAGNGSSTFNLPNFVNRFPVGAGNVTPRGGTGGAFNATLTVPMLPSHAHSIDHDHFNSTTTDAAAHAHDLAHTHFASATNSSAHGHALDYRAPGPTTGGNGANVAWGTTGTASIQSPAAVAPDGVHTHTIGVAAAVGNTNATGGHNHGVDITAFNGSSGNTGGGAALPTTPPWQGIAYVIKY